MGPQTQTFLFADLVGFTALAEMEGDDRALEAVLALQRRVHQLLEEHSAEQVKAIGDGLMLRCRDPRAAVKLGLRVIEELADETGVPPVRVGIHSGPALAQAGDWYGRTVNVAARLCAVAPGGEVMVSETTRTAAGEIAGVEWGERELHWLRNVSEPVGTYLVSGRPNHSAAPTPPPRGRPQLGFLCPRNLTREATG
ncbi:MAG TPA: adenylate/guanylate cyclase domain-containing protein [Solirubrobacteraceae bacterium]|nr:adenylate/guanylate cyclase domain-containing protein [Solirubrobacteraceae bacterium]